MSYMNFKPSIFQDMKIKIVEQVLFETVSHEKFEFM